MRKYLSNRVSLKSTVESFEGSSNQRALFPYQHNMDPSLMHSILRPKGGPEDPKNHKAYPHLVFSRDDELGGPKKFYIQSSTFKFHLEFGV